MALAGVAMGESYTMDKGGSLYAGEMTLAFTIPETSILTDDYDILAAYYQVNNGGNYTVNAFVLSSSGTLTLNRGGNLSSTDLSVDTTLGTTQNRSIFKTDGGADYVLSAGDYTIEYLGAPTARLPLTFCLAARLWPAF